MKYLIGFVVGLVVATVGFSNISKILDNGVGKIKETLTEQAR